MSKIFTSIILTVMWVPGFAISQTPLPTKENPTPEQLAAFDQMMNRVSQTQHEIRQAQAFLEVYQQEERKWPESWSAVESKLGPSMWESPEVRQSFTKSFVLLRGIPGHIKTREEGEYDSTMMMVMAAPIERKLSQDKRELGRWAVWKTFRGQFVTRWHPEQEITSFSAWPEVQSAIGEHIKTVGRADDTTPSPQQTQATLTQPPTSKKAPEAKPTASTPSEESTSSTPWSIIAVLIMAATGLLWLLVKKRK